MRTDISNLLNIGFAMANVEPLIKQTKTILRIYRSLRWILAHQQFDLQEELADVGWSNHDTGITYLTAFAPEINLRKFEMRVRRLMENRSIVTFIDKTIIRLKEYPVYGNEYYDIIKMQYLINKGYKETDVLEILCIERSTFYRRKKEALYLLGLCLFGLMPKEIESQEYEQLSMFTVI